MRMLTSTKIIKQHRPQVSSALWVLSPVFVCSASPSVVQMADTHSQGLAGEHGGSFSS